MFSNQDSFSSNNGSSDSDSSTLNLDKKSVPDKFIAKTDSTIVPFNTDIGEMENKEVTTLKSDVITDVPLNKPVIKNEAIDISIKPKGPFECSTCKVHRSELAVELHSSQLLKHRCSY